MPSKTLVFCLICLLFWPAAVFVDGQIRPYVFNLLWWMVTQTGATTMSRAAFFLNSWLPLAAFEGFLFGLIPVQQIRVWLASAFTRFQYLPADTSPSELGPMRPALWGWVLPTTLFLIRFLTWSSPYGGSVLGNSTTGDGRVAHFFGAATQSSLSANPASWFFDRFYLTGPMLILLAYPAAVWLRHHLHLPQHPILHEASDSEPSSLVHSSPIHNMIEPTEIPE